MTTTLPPFPNCEFLVRDALATWQPTWHVGGATPDDFAGQLPFVALRRAGGPSDVVNDYPILQVQVFAGDLETASTVAEAIRSWFADPEPKANSHGQIDRATCTSGHVEQPHPSLRHLVTLYRLTCRRIHAA